MRSPVSMAIEDQMPVSEIADVKVEMLPVTTAPSERDPKDRRGVLVWNFDVGPGEVRDIKLAWRVRWPPTRRLCISRAYEGCAHGPDGQVLAPLRRFGECPHR